MARDRRRLAAIVSADVAGYSRLMGQDESRTLAALKDHRRELIDPKIAEYGGRIVKTTGDGLLVEFPSVVDAVRCSVDVQRGMAERNVVTPHEQRIAFRIGINIGDVIIDGDDIFGDGVNVAARLQALAEPGGICASKVVRDQVLDKLSFTFEDLGPQQVKNIARPVQAYRVDLTTEGAARPKMDRLRLWRAAFASRSRRSIAAVLVFGLGGVTLWSIAPLRNLFTDPPRLPMSVAILPFATSQNVSAEKEFADALRLDLLTGLARRVNAIKIDSSAGSTEPRRHLVRYLVEGDVRGDVAGHMLNLRLLDARTGTQLWAQRYDLPASPNPAESGVKLRDVVRGLTGSVRDAETKRVISERLDRLTAMELLLRGYASLGNAQSLSQVESAKALFDAARRSDPNLVEALVARSDLLDLEIDLNPNADRQVVAREMDQYTTQALTLDSGSPDVWRARSIAMADAGRWSAAFEAIDHAIKLDPYDPQLRVYKAMWMNMTGRPAAALEIVDNAMTMEPSYSGWAMMVACQAYVLSGRASNAIDTCEKSAPLEPNPLVQVLLAAAYANHGDLEKAAAARERVLRYLPGYTVSQLRAKRYSEDPEYLKLAEAYWYPGLLKAGFAEH